MKILYYTEVSKKYNKQGTAHKLGTRTKTDTSLTQGLCALPLTAQAAVYLFITEGQRPLSSPGYRCSISLFQYQYECKRAGKEQNQVSCKNQHNRNPKAMAPFRHQFEFQTNSNLWYYR